MEAIRYAFVSDAPLESIVALYRAGGWWQETEHARAIIPAMIRGSFAFLVASAADGQLVGMGRVIADGASDGYIQDLVVLPQYRGRGIGRELVQRLVGRCRECRLEWIGLLAEQGTEGFYEALGFHTLVGHTGMRHA